MGIFGYDQQSIAESRQSQVVRQSKAETIQLMWGREEHTGNFGILSRSFSSHFRSKISSFKLPGFVSKGKLMLEEFSIGSVFDALEVCFLDIG